MLFWSFLREAATLIADCSEESCVGQDVRTSPEERGLHFHKKEKMFLMRSLIESFLLLSTNLKLVFLITNETSRGPNCHLQLRSQAHLQGAYLEDEQLGPYPSLIGDASIANSKLTCRPSTPAPCILYSQNYRFILSWFFLPIFS